MYYVISAAENTPKISKEVSDRSVRSVSRSCRSRGRLVRVLAQGAQVRGTIEANIEQEFHTHTCEVPLCPVLWGCVHFWHFEGDQYQTFAACSYTVLYKLVHQPIHSDSDGDLAPSLGVTEKFFRGPRFLNEVFLGKKFHFHGQNFLRPILCFFLFCFFSHWPGLLDFPFLLPDFLFLLLCSMSYMTLSSQDRTTTISENNSFMTLFFYSVRTFARIRPLSPL